MATWPVFGVITVPDKLISLECTPESLGVDLFLSPNLGGVGTHPPPSQSLDALQCKPGGNSTIGWEGLVQGHRPASVSERVAMMRERSRMNLDSTQKRWHGEIRKTKGGNAGGKDGGKITLLKAGYVGL